MPLDPFSEPKQVQDKPSLTVKLKATSIKVFRPPFKYLFILGHMRSGSTLLVHILNSNPDIAGFGETILKYESRHDFDNLLVKLAEFFKTKRLPQAFAMDKLLQDGLLLNPDLLNEPDIYSLFLVRKPEKSLPSILDIYENKYPLVAPSLAGGEPEALNYYTERLVTLESYAQLIKSKDKKFFLTYEDLIDRSESVFRGLQDWLGVRQPFSEKYDTHEATGKLVTGDHSETIKTGRIVREEKSKYRDVSAESLSQARESYESCCRALRELCRSVDGAAVASGTKK